jgi:hypothetical protein
VNASRGKPYAWQTSAVSATAQPRTGAARRARARVAAPGAARATLAAPGAGSHAGAAPGRAAARRVGHVGPHATAAPAS